MAVDPVCGADIGETSAPSSDFQGKTYYFCSIDCKDEFDDEPERYVGWEGIARHQGFA